MCNVPRSEEARRQLRLPRALEGLGLYSAVEIGHCAYIGSVVDSAAIPTDVRGLSPAIEDIYDEASPLLHSLQSYMEAPEGRFLPPTTPSFFLVRLFYHRSSSVRLYFTRRLRRRWV